MIHFHIDFLHFPLARHCPTPCLTTLHGRLDLPDLAAAAPALSRAAAGVDLRQPARAAAAARNWLATVHHGLPEDLYHFHPRAAATTSPSSAASRRRSASTARSRSPGHAACRCASRPRSTASTRPTSSARSSRCSTIRWSSTSARSATAQKNDFIGNARALLFPIDWPEPFGLVMIEALACGTPVIAYALRLGARGDRARRHRLHRRRHQARPSTPRGASARIDRRRLPRRPSSSASRRATMAERYVEVYRRTGCRDARLPDTPAVDREPIIAAMSRCTPTRSRSATSWYVLATSAPRRGAAAGPEARRDVRDVRPLRRHQALGRGEQGLYHNDTRYLSHLELLIDGARPLHLGSAVQRRQQPARRRADEPRPARATARWCVPKGTLHIFRAKLLWQGACYEHIRAHQPRPRAAAAAAGADASTADFVDLFEVRGMQRERRGERAAARGQGATR